MTKKIFFITHVSKLTTTSFSTALLFLIALSHPAYADNATLSYEGYSWIWAGAIAIAIIGLAVTVFIIVMQNARFKRVEEKLRQGNRQLEERATTLDMEIADRQLTERKLAEQLEISEAQQQTIQELSTPVIPVMDQIIVMPLIGNIDTMRARDITRSLLAGISQHRAKVVILDVTGVPLMDTGIVNHLNRTIQAARLKGTRVIVTGISDVVAESIVDLGVNWSGITTLSDLQDGLLMALKSLGVRLSK